MLVRVRVRVRVEVRTEVRTEMRLMVRAEVRLMVRAEVRLMVRLRARVRVKVGWPLRVVHTWFVLNPSRTHLPQVQVARLAERRSCMKAHKVVRTLGHTLQDAHLHLEVRPPQRCPLRRPPEEWVLRVALGR